MMIRRPSPLVANCHHPISFTTLLMLASCIPRSHDLLFACRLRVADTHNISTDKVRADAAVPALI